MMAFLIIHYPSNPKSSTETVQLSEINGAISSSLFATIVSPGDGRMLDT